MQIGEVSKLSSKFKSLLPVVSTCHEYLSYKLLNIIRLGLFINLTLSDGIVYVRVSVWLYVYSGHSFLKACSAMFMVASGHHWGFTLGSFLIFSKILVFGHFLSVFGSKLTPKLTFLLNQGAFFSGWVQDGF